MLSVTDLHTYYGDSHVLQGVSLEVRPANGPAEAGHDVRSDRRLYFLTSSLPHFLTSLLPYFLTSSLPATPR